MPATDPRARIAFTGLDYHGTTYQHDSSIVYDGTLAGGAATTMIGKAVALKADGQVGLTVDAEAVVGRLQSVDSDGFCAVQDQGFCELPGGASATLTVGSPIVGALGAAGAHGYIRTAAANSAEAIAKRGRIVNNDTTTAVVVEL